MRQHVYVTALDTLETCHINQFTSPGSLPCVGMALAERVVSNRTDGAQLQLCAPWPHWCGVFSRTASLKISVHATSKCFFGFFLLGWGGGGLSVLVSTKNPQKKEDFTAQLSSSHTSFQDFQDVDQQQNIGFNWVGVILGKPLFDRLLGWVIQKPSLFFDVFGVLKDWHFRSRWNILLKILRGVWLPFVVYI